MAQIDLEEFLPEIERIARIISSDFPDIDWEDVRQELCLYVLQNPSLNVEGSGFSVKKILSRHAFKYCKKQRAEQLYLCSQYSYRPSDIKKLFESGGIKIPEDAVSEEKTEMDKYDIRADVYGAIARLGLDHRLALYRRYTLGIVPENASYERKKLNSAIRALTNIMNTYNSLNRKVINNATAQAIISKGW